MSTDFSRTSRKACPMILRHWCLTYLLLTTGMVAAADNPIPMSVELSVENALEGQSDDWYSSVTDQSSDYVLVKATITPSWLPVSNLTWNTVPGVEANGADGRKVPRQAVFNTQTLTVTLTYEGATATDSIKVTVVDIKESDEVDKLHLLGDGTAAPVRTDYFAALKQKDPGQMKLVLDPDVAHDKLPDDFVNWSGAGFPPADLDKQKHRRFSLGSVKKWKASALLALAPATKKYEVVCYAIWCQKGGYSPPDGKTGNHFADNNNLAGLWVGGAGEVNRVENYTRGTTKYTINKNEIQFTLTPAEFLADGKTNLYDRSAVDFDVRRDRIGRAWHRTTAGGWQPYTAGGGAPDPSWASDDTLSHDDEDNEPYDSAQGHLYGADGPGIPSTLLNATRTHIIQKLNMNEWVRCRLDGQPAETSAGIMSQAKTAGHLASEPYRWHSFIGITRDTFLDVIRMPAADCENEIPTGHKFWGGLPFATLHITTTEQIIQANYDTPMTFDIRAADGTTPYAWSIGYGALPDGLTLITVDNVGIIWGTPTSTAIGLHEFNIVVTDQTGAAASQNFSINVREWHP